MYVQSKEYLDAKWTPVPMSPEDVPAGEGGEEEDVSSGSQAAEEDSGRNVRCVICGKKLPAGRHKYCSDVCEAEAQSIRASGGTVPNARREAWSGRSTPRRGAGSDAQ